LAFSCLGVVSGGSHFIIGMGNKLIKKPSRGGLDAFRLLAFFCCPTAFAAGKKTWRGKKDISTFSIIGRRAE